MKSLLEVDRQPFPDQQPASASASPRQRLSRRTRWILSIGAGALFVAALGYLIPDQVQAHDQYDRAQSALGVTGRQTKTISIELAEVRRALSILKTQVGSDSTALNQDSSQLLGAQTSLAAAQAHVTQQSSLISSLQSCLVGVEHALNEIAVGNQADAITALNSVSTSCTAAEASSG